jgi:hypothetical protein
MRWISILCLNLGSCWVFLSVSSRIGLGFERCPDAGFGSPFDVGLWLGFGPAFGFGFQMFCHSGYLSWALQWSQWGNTSWTRSSLAVWDICRGPYRGLKGALSLGGVVTMRVWA